MKHIFSLICALSTLTLLLSSTALAHPPVRCNGKIQFRPCRKPLKIKKTIESKTMKASLRRTTPRKEVEVINPQFRKVGTQRGEWRGKIRGRGLVHLSLQFFQQGSLLSQRYMGNVALNKDKDESISFKFTSPLPPKSRQWSWKVEAYT